MYVTGVEALGCWCGCMWKEMQGMGHAVVHNTMSSSWYLIHSVLYSHPTALGSFLCCAEAC